MPDSKPKSIFLELSCTKPAEVFMSMELFLVLLSPSSYFLSMATLLQPSAWASLHSLRAPAKYSITSQSDLQISQVQLTNVEDKSNESLSVVGGRFKE